jgi:Rod binding domain-containing protein
MDFGNISNLTDYTASMASAQNAQKLGSNAQAAKTDEEMLDACKEFETYLWEQVIKSMKSASEVFSDGEKSPQVDYFMDTAITKTAEQMTEQSLGSNSLAMQMYEQMKRNSGLTMEEILAKNAAEQGAVTGGDTEE